MSPDKHYYHSIKSDVNVLNSLLTVGIIGGYAGFAIAIVT